MTVIPSFTLLTLLSGAGSAQRSAAAVESPRATAIRSLGLPSFQGSLLTFYSSHSAERAQYLQQLLSGDIDYFSPPHLDSAQVLATLEKLAGGWNAWAARVEAGDVQTSMQPEAAGAQR